jgi:hypothetical protein
VTCRRVGCGNDAARCLCRISCNGRGGRGQSSKGICKLSHWLYALDSSRMSCRNGIDADRGTHTTTSHRAGCSRMLSAAVQCLVGTPAVPEVNPVARQAAGMLQGREAVAVHAHASRAELLKLDVAPDQCSDAPKVLSVSILSASACAAWWTGGSVGSPVIGGLPGGAIRRTTSLFQIPVANLPLMENGRTRGRRRLSGPEWRC